MSEQEIQERFDRWWRDTGVYLVGYAQTGFREISEAAAKAMATDISAVHAQKLDVEQKKVATLRDRLIEIRELQEQLDAKD